MPANLRRHSRLQKWIPPLLCKLYVPQESDQNKVSPCWISLLIATQWTKPSSFSRQSTLLMSLFGSVAMFNVYEDVWDDCKAALYYRISSRNQTIHRTFSTRRSVMVPSDHQRWDSSIQEVAEKMFLVGWRREECVPNRDRLLPSLMMHACS